uniref:Crossover junction endonuclease MUS81 n=1 Tax=Syphacia muris TaxID=451379 RepID=A0A158R5K6_9BILA
MDSDIICLSDDETTVAVEPPVSDSCLPLSPADIDISLNDCLLSANLDAEHTDVGTNVVSDKLLKRYTSQPISTNACTDDNKVNDLEPQPLNKRSKILPLKTYASENFEITKRNKQKKRTAEELERDAITRKAAQAKKLEERIAKKKENELAKKIAKFHRDLNASKKSKCEQNLFCIVDSSIFAAFDSLEATVRQIFTDRKIGEQLILETTSDMNICWKRRYLEACITDGQFIQKEKLVFEKFCMTFMTGDEFKQLNKSRKFFQKLEIISKSLPFSPQLTVVVYGAKSMNVESVTHIELEAYERYRIQLRFVNSIYEIGILIARMHRSIAKLLWHAEDAAKIIFETEKGVKEGTGLVKDWWSKMLKHTFRLHKDQHRALIERFPEPFSLTSQCVKCFLLLEMGMVDSIKFLANIRTDENRCIGPVIAKKIFYLLTSQDGTEIIDE